ncbi:class I fructose-bisphosphate aldolase [Pseudonocardia sp. GCM10023141]|uniref:class I fructose-bisphosphate aldolase n=1 Tax=Pseudonocardia sp. GCM10023141 TaxID=3252653 RepID=UPI00360894B3
MDALRQCLDELFTPGRGIVAVDTTPATLATRLRSVDLAPSAEAVDSYLDMLLGTPELAAAASGVVLAPEEFDGERAQRLRAAGIRTGVRADTGHERLAADARDRVTTGLEGLSARLGRLHDLGASFAVWSAVARPTADRRGERVLTANSQAAARFAHLCQGLGVVPVVRIGTRVGGAEGAQRSETAGAALRSFVAHLGELDVDPAATVISTELDPDADRAAIGAGLLDAIPAGIGGVAITTSGYSLHDAVEAISAVCSAAPPWPVTFYAGRHLTRPALQAWQGRDASISAGRRALAAGLAEASAAVLAGAVTGQG